ncbi:FAD-binding oxidoreductase [Agrobacterium larrymoorei]|uniref:FAD-binding oxidoreductase n=1 Tax=Agrobacterium larrymoorei TaxID=160699 RepID=A0AAF0H948_9HYPH|nr:FAD-binding oxidoreductase [Agrobacterium larrymoorei]WHA40380.1 FAD-binding oxidoreductase [Agrobacterium larrymoorei]
MTKTPRELAEVLRLLHPDLHVSGPDALAGRDPGEHPKNLDAGVMASPSSTEAAAALIRWCHEQDVVIVPQGGRTGLAGGCESRPGDIILSSARLNAIEAINEEERTAVVQAGVGLQTLQEAAALYGLTPGIDLPSRGTATLGGMASTNAGGLLAFRNGVMRHQILGIEAILPDGSVFSDMTRVVKVSAGPDLKHLLIGAEGALGFITRLVVKLEPLRPFRATAMLGVNNAASALAVAAHLIRAPGLTLEAAEMMWPLFIRDHARIRNFDLSWLPEEASAFIVEVSAVSEEAAISGLEEALAEIWEAQDLQGGIVAQSLDQARRFWVLREESGFYYDIFTDPISLDVSLPPAALDPYVAGLRQRLYALNADYHAYVYGHIADGNLHLTVARDKPEDEAEVLRIEDAVYTGIREAGGSFSAEHGVGFEKRHGYENYSDPVKRALAISIKRLLDPKGLFNPGKVPFAEVYGRRPSNP